MVLQAFGLHSEAGVIHFMFSEVKRWKLIAILWYVDVNGTLRGGVVQHNICEQLLAVGRQIVHVLHVPGLMFTK